MTAGLPAFHDQAIGAAAFHADRHRHAGNDRKDLCAALLQHRHIYARIAGTGRHQGDTFLSDHLHQLFRIGIHHHHIDTERPIGQRTAAMDGLPCLFDVHGAGADHTDAAGVGYCRRKFCGGDIRHRSLYDRIFD